MLINIPIVKHLSFDCYQENIISPICHYWNRDIQPAFFKLFDFNYEVKKHIGKALFESECISPYSYSDTEQGNNIDTLKLYSGINIFKDKNIELNQREKIIKSMLINEKPVGIAIDSFYLPWNRYYNILGRNHYLMIVGINDSDEFMCYDSFLSSRIENIPKDRLLPYINEFVFFEEIKSLMKIDKSIIANMLNNKSLLEYKDKYTQMLCFGDYMENYNISMQELNKFKDINLSPLFFMINCLGWCRYNYLQSLILISKKHGINIFDDLIQKLDLINKKWVKVKNLLIKGFVKNKDGNFLKSIGNEIKTIAVDEYSFVEEIYEIAEKI